MKKNLSYIIGIILLLFFLGCSMKGTVREDYIALKVGERMTARTGDVFFAQRDDPATPGQELSFNLTIFRLSNREIILKMVQYRRGNSNGGKKEKNVSWEPLASVKTFTYPLSGKNISFRGFTFRVLRTEGDEVVYQRLR